METKFCTMPHEAKRRALYKVDPDRLCGACYRAILRRAKQSPIRRAGRSEIAAERLERAIEYRRAYLQTPRGESVPA